MPTFSWEKENGNTFTEVVGATIQTLRFNPAMFFDEGRYQCIATVNFPMGLDNMTTSISNLATLTSELIIGLDALYNLLSRIIILVTFVH